MESKDLKSEIEIVANKFLVAAENKEIFVISHFDTDGITSATIMIQTLKKLDKVFSVKILKRIEDDTIQNLPKDKIILFLDLASASLDKIIENNLKDVFIIDHHELTQAVPENIFMVNPQLNGKEELSSSSLVYLFCKHLTKENKEFAKLAILGMIGDSMEKSIDKLNNLILILN